MAMTEASLSGGARSAAKLIKICGTTEVKSTSRLRTSKTVAEDVRGRPIVSPAARKLSSRISGRTRTRSSRGVMSNSPHAYLVPLGSGSSRYTVSMCNVPNLC
jgi:hypothetical protein